MSTPPHKKSFEWQEGQVMDDGDVEAVNEVRSHGLPKIKNAVSADPVQRKKDRDNIVMTQKTKPYASKSDQKGSDVLIDGSDAGLSEEFENSQAEKLIDHGKKFQGIDRFRGKDHDTDKD